MKKLLGALLLSLVFHASVMLWQWPSEQVEVTSAGRSVVAIKQFRIVEAVVETVSAPPPAVEKVSDGPVQDKPPERDQGLLTTNRTEVVQAKEVQQQPQETDVAQVEEITEQQTTEQEEMSIEPQETEVASAEVVTTSEVEAEFAGFEQIPTMQQPRYRKAFPPHYPKVARRRGHQGIVMVRAKVGVDGEVEAVELMASSGYDVLDDSALTTVSQWEFFPYQINDQLSVAWVEVPVEFILGR